MSDPGRSPAADPSSPGSILSDDPSASSTSSSPHASPPHPSSPEPNEKPNPPSPKSHPKNKPCTLCHTPRPVLVRCQIDETEKWHFVCPGKCWKSVSGGVEDAKGMGEEFRWYRYGGMWKNKYAGVSAKKPKKKKKKVAVGDSAAQIGEAVS